MLFGTGKVCLKSHSVDSGVGRAVSHSLAVPLLLEVLSCTVPLYEQKPIMLTLLLDLPINIRARI